MKKVWKYLSAWICGTDKTQLAIVTVYTACLVFVNYRFGLDRFIASQDDFILLFLLRYLLFLAAFAVPYLVVFRRLRMNRPRDRRFLILMIVAPAFFALKTALSLDLAVADATFWNKVVYWPFLLVVMIILLSVTRKLNNDPLPLYGVTSKDVNFRPYLLMLLIMLPLIGLASTRPDFLHSYPKLQRLAEGRSLAEIPFWKKCLFELSYGMDFISIELFFRGFLVLAFIKWAGKDVVLPMACFYCTIHFGKPLGECISSYFGGILLGVLVFNTRSVLGGLLVHLGIAWLMEAGGYLGNTWFR